MTLVDRDTRCILSWRVVEQRTVAEAQAMIDESLPAGLYFSDGLELWRAVVYLSGTHWVAWGKSQTYSVEGNNAELRHYLARLARKSRCFSRSLKALQRSVKLFVFAWNARQLYKRRFPNYPAHLMNFVSL